MRPTYEDAGDRAIEQEFKERFEKVHPSYKLYKAKMSVHYDFTVEHNKRIVAIIEHKQRNIDHNKYPDLQISELKLRACHEAAKFMQVPFKLYVRYNDGYYRWDYDHTEIDYFNTIGLTINNRNDPQDVEAQAHIPIKHFKRVKL